MKLITKICFWILILLMGCYVLLCMNDLEGFKGGRRHGGKRRGGRGHGRGRRWRGDDIGYGYGRRRYGINYYPNYYPNYYGYNNRWTDYIYRAPVVSYFYNYWNACKNGCINLGNGEWGCQYPGNGPNDCTFATDCYGCGNVY